MSETERKTQRDALLGARRPVLVLAPHLQYPTRDGADIAIDRRWGELSRFISHVDIVGMNEIVRYSDGRITCREHYRNAARSKGMAALRTALFRSNYNKEKFITPIYFRVARQRILTLEYQAVIYSYLTTASIGCELAGSSIRQYVLSHNDDVKIFHDMRVNTRNPFGKLVARLSENWVRERGRRWRGLKYIHCTEVDASGWSRAIGPHDYLLGEVGCNLPAEFQVNHAPLGSHRSVRLIFVGSLGVKMNYDALQHFADCYFPVLKSYLHGHLDVRVVGSNPPGALERFCRLHGFSLYANVSDNELDQHLGWADFSILPFKYSSGTKLKLLTSTSRGVPALMTSAVGHGPGSEHPLCLVSDDPLSWALHIDQFRNRGIAEEDRRSLFQMSQPWSWRSMAEKFFVSELSGDPLIPASWSSSDDSLA